MADEEGRLVDTGSTRLFVVERGAGFPLILLHGGPGLDHHEFGDYLDPLTERCRLLLVDQRSQGRSETTPPETWTVERMAQDVSDLARSLRLERYAVLGHSYGAFVALQHAVDFPGQAAATIVSGGVPDVSYLSVVEENLARFEPEDLRSQVANSWAREAQVETQADVAAVLDDQWPFHFADPRDPRILEYRDRISGMVYAPDMLRRFAEQEGGIQVEERLARVTQPVLVMTGRHDRVCTTAAAQAIAAGIPDAELVIFEHSGHMTFVEETGRYLQVVAGFLERRVLPPA